MKEKENSFTDSRYSLLLYSSLQSLHIYLKSNNSLTEFISLLQNKKFSRENS